MKSAFVIRARAGLVAIVLFALSANGVSFYLWSLEIQRPPPTDEISAYEERVQVLKSQLPQRGIVGYRTYQPVWRTPNGDIHGEAAAVKGLYLTQYALAPVIVDCSSDHPLVIGSYDTGIRVLRGDAK